MLAMLPFCIRYYLFCNCNHKIYYIKPPFFTRNEIWMTRLCCLFIVWIYTLLTWVSLSVNVNSNRPQHFPGRANRQGWVEAIFVAMKMKSWSWLNGEGDLICALSCIEPRIFIFSFIFLPTFPLVRVVGRAAVGLGQWWMNNKSVVGLLRTSGSNVRWVG